MLDARVETWVDWGRSPKFEGGRRPMHPSPNISRNTVIGCEAKYEVTKKVLQQEFRVGKYPHFVKFFVKTGSNRQT